MKDEKKPLIWWLRLAIAVISAVAGMLVENSTNFIGNLF